MAESKGLSYREPTKNVEKRRGGFGASERGTQKSLESGGGRGYSWGGRGVCEGGRGLQGAVPRVVFGQNVLTAAELLPQFGHLLSERRVLFLQESRADGDLVLLESASVPRAFRRDVVLSAPRPVSVILRGDGTTV